VLALTLWQPWATLIALGHKDIENREWAPPQHLIGKRFAIHAGKTVEPGVADDLPGTYRKYDWFQGKFGWHLDHVIGFNEAPIECRGAQGLWPVPEEIEAMVLKLEGARR